MTTVTINIDDYLSEDEKKQIVTDEYRNLVAKSFDSRSEIDRILGNASYHAVWKITDDCLDGDSKEAVRLKVLKVIDNLTEYSVFYDGGYVGKPNEAHKFLMRCVKENEPRIKAIIGDQVEKTAAKAAANDVRIAVAHAIMETIDGVKEWC